MLNVNTASWCLYGRPGWDYSSGVEVWLGFRARIVGLSVDDTLRNPCWRPIVFRLAREDGGTDDFDKFTTAG